MRRSVGRIIFIVVACLAIAFPATISAVMWGEWRCGINGISLVMDSALSALVVTGCLAGVRWCTAPEERFSWWVLSWPWIAFGVTVFLFTLCPPCPFMSR